MPHSTMSGHRFTYHAYLLENRETGRYTDTAGNQIVLESAHATLTTVAQWPIQRVGQDFGIHRAVDADGTEGYILKVRGTAGQIQLVAQKVGQIRVDHYCPRDERAPGFYGTVEDARVGAGDKAAIASEQARLEEMMTLAKAAASALDGDGNLAWSRDAYVAACTAAGLDPADDDTVTRLAGPGGGVFTIPEYHREHVVWVRLAYHRAQGIEAELTEAETRALTQAERAVGTGTYARADYETACSAAGIDPLADAVIPAITARYYLAGLQPVRDVLGEMKATAMLGATPQAAARLAARRHRGIAAELAERRARERRALEAEGHDFATADQVETIERLLAHREQTGDGGGFFAGPTDPEGVANLSKKDADLYITSLEGEY